jgi:hypothetical protein
LITKVFKTDICGDGVCSGNEACVSLSEDGTQIKTEINSDQSHTALEMEIV